MANRRSIRARFTRFSIIFLSLIFVLGAFSLWRLGDYNRVTSEIQKRFLPTTRFLGDLNNFTSDFRAAEATGLLAETAEQTAANAKIVADLDRHVRTAQVDYLRVTGGAQDRKLYQAFETKWAAYEGTANEVLALAARRQRRPAVEIYLSRSRLAYDAASNALGVLTETNIAEAGAAVAHADEAYYEALLLTGLAVGCAGAMALGATAYMRRSISDPLLALAQSMRRLAANRMDVEILNADRGDEIGEMARAVGVFRNNAVELAVSQRALAEQASLLGEKLAYEQRLTQAQRNFVSMAAHEFRTPLTIIDGHAQRMIKSADRLTPDDVSERARKVRSAVLRMSSVIDNLLDAGRLFDGDAGLYFHPETLDVASLLREVCRLHREVSPTVHIWENFGAQGLETVGDAKLLFQAFSNLISNGIKYSPGSPVLKITASRVEEHLRIEIEDKGIGIPAQDMGSLFERYFRGGNVSGIVGAGVGLFLVKTVVDMHGGSIDVRSTVGEGSCFIVHLPIKPLAARG